jgi:hypothetical protein
MKGERLREMLKFMGYDPASLLLKSLYDELDELERLADIGRATELAYEKEFCITNNGWQEIYLDTVEELLEWAKEQTK